ncbi:S1 RNA-binding domain-containing protein [Bdellovibrio sp. HCB337]|uniref:CvfB family protein n=1 Tax=Bdellovibrio sp. HCB337 TaxID=3394358 RepID=UPI0039A75655
MIKIGNFNKLQVLKHVDFGVYLDGDEESGEILLPRKYVPENCQVGDFVEVFLCYDSEDRLIATTETPKAQVGDIATLKVVGTSSVGAFLDWGLPKDLFLPFAEQNGHLRVGDTVIVYLYLDNTNRIASSMRLDRKVNKEPAEYEAGQSVDLLIVDKTDLGYKALINNQHWGMIYTNEVFQPLKYGQKTQGFIKEIRPSDGKIDLRLYKTGHQGGDEIATRILEMLQKADGGFLAINDKTSAEKIYELFGASKKKYKIALGGLYKKRLITITDDGIRLNPAKATKN